MSGDSFEIGRPGTGAAALTAAVLDAIRGGASRSIWDDRPIREELFSVERLEEHARSLASAQAVAPRLIDVRNLSKRLAENERLLLDAYRETAQAVGAGAPITPAAEWLIDNFHVVEEQIRNIRSDLPPGYHRQLPKLAGGPFAGLPRVFGIAWAFVAHTDSLFEPEVLRRYMLAYQQVQPLTVGELWAVAITLRLVLVENLRRIAGRVVASRVGRHDADAIADRLLGARGLPAEPAEETLAGLRKGELSEAFFVQMVQRLRDQDPSIAPALGWLDEQLTARGATADSVVRDEHQRQVAASVTVRNIITSMRLISDVDWSELVERISLVDRMFGAASRFSEMDFATRNLYRTAVEELARGSALTELDVAQSAIAAPAQTQSGGDERLADPGYYLLGGGRAALERAIGFRPPLNAVPGRLYRAFGIGGYVSAGALVATAALACPLALLALARAPAQWLWLLGLLGVAPAVDLAVAIVNHAVTRGFRATLIPGLELKTGIPPALRTLVVVPTLLTSEKAVAEHVERLEVHYLASPEGELYFALLTDWTDADAETVAGDAALLAAARAGVAELNRRHGAAPGGARFLLLHRRRVWNESERRWIGWERKRGKLAELNRLLRGATDTTFLEPPSVPASVRYVITLDADTQLPRDTVRRLIGKMAHPLNRPRVDAALARVMDGHAILQPRVTPSLPVGREGSLFLRVFSSAAGIDPYAAAVSDVYQDLFGEGSYTGKGIYDVDAFEAATAGRVPDSTLLSHDLFEGVFARAGLASDVEVVEGFPARYDIAAVRHHRWARGDWQLLPWLIGLPPAVGDGRSGGVPMIGRWKMLDNLRRSASAPSTVAAFLAGWAAPQGAALVWTSFIVLTMALPPLLPVAAELPRRRPGVALGSHLRNVASDLCLAVVQLALMLVFLGHQAWLMGDAILRTLVRMFITHRRLLQWTPSAQGGFGAAPTIGRFYRYMAGAVLIAAVGLVCAWRGGGYAWPLAGLFAVAWTASPAVALWASRSPRVAERMQLNDAEATALRLIGRRTWRYFATFVTPTSNALPPDNFQETPRPVVAPRTSPTNIGLYLLSVASARDFGWIGELEAADRLEATLATIARLERYRGHLYNWYDTQDLRPLDPRYVSSVDSGNLAGHLLALAGACREWRRSGLADAQRFSGVLDALAVAKETASASRTRARAHLLAEIDVLARSIGEGDARRWASLEVEVERVADAARSLAIEESDQGVAADVLHWLDAARLAMVSHARDLTRSARESLDPRLAGIEATAAAMALAMDFTFLLDPDRLLLSIGFSTVEGARDPSCYDLLASEARLASFVAIAKGDVPARHWFRLGRAVTSVGGGAALISWSGSMFEYLMPSLVMRAPAQTLIESTGRLVVWRQIEYGRKLGAPWGVSESAYNARDLEFTYQYSNFGVPGLGLKRGLADNAVIAPYATALASMVDPQAAVRNFGRLSQIGAEGRYGYYEAVDFTPPRVPEGQTAAVVQAFMAHHQGMTIVAIADTLLDGRMRTRFHADPIVQSAELLLQERVPRDVISTPPSVAETTWFRTRVTEGGWREASPWSATPDTQLLSNGRYTVMVTAAGGGYAAWRDIAVTRWREDATCDDWGSWVYLRDTMTGDVWSAGLQPTGVAPDSYGVVFNEDRVEISRRDGDLASTLEVVVSAEDDAEVRRLTLANLGSKPREIEVTSYVELALAAAAADASHPAFSKMFVETEHLAAAGALVAHRRRRGPDEPEVWAAHLAVVEGEAIGTREFETDRARFIGRGHGVHTPSSVVGARPLSGAVGTVLDPVFALRRRVRLEPGKSARVGFWTMVASSRVEILALIDKHHDVGAFDRAAALAWTQAQVQLHHLDIDQVEAGQLQRLAGHLIYAAPTLRPPSEIIQSGVGGQSSLWRLGISGDLPIMLVRVAELHQLDLAREALTAVEYWRTKRLAVDLVILNERGISYVQDMQVALETLVRASQSRPQPDGERAPGHVFLLRGDLIAPEVIAIVGSIARIVLMGERGRLADQMEYAPEARSAVRQRLKRQLAASELQVARAAPDMEYFNGLGGFADKGREYVILIGPGRTTPAPWINVIANPEFGFQVSAEGGGYAWSANSKDHQITPWSNDPVTDQPGQTIFVRDNDSGELWTATVEPLRDEAGAYVARHGFGYSRFQHAARGLALDLLEYVPPEDPVRISRLTIRNTGQKPRKLSVTAYAEWVLGASRGYAPFVRTAIDPETRALFASNRWNAAFAERVAFMDLRGQQTGWTGDRREFIGRNGSLGLPLALVENIPLSGRVGAGLDPCGVLETRLELAPGASVEVALLLGDAASEAEARKLVAFYRTADLDAVLDAVRREWDETLGLIQVKTPDRSMDLMLNGWLLYQTLSSRVWARTGFYQASGAFGFRDQLQDVIALAASRPDLTRAHLLRAAARQFVEGDVQHWWLPHSGQGVRTRISDDRLWLPYAVARYLEVTGDASVLDELVPFLTGAPLEGGEAERFFQPDASETSASLYEHCVRAIEASLAVGRHELPLIGGGDWNDGLNRVGLGGQGESVWLGWFLIDNLQTFATIAESRGDTERAAGWRARSAALKEALERAAWDGEWYRRGWFDDGTPFGSAANAECRIDSISQSWAVLSGAGESGRAVRAMAAVERELVLSQDTMALLFTPPFDHNEHDPGYIMGYPPGLRENGGQYTHAAAWSVMAFAALGDGGKAAALFWMLNPINHARTRTDAHRYKVEPYVAVADVYAAPGQLGRGGWTWYTGSAGWLQRAGVEGILGLRLRAGRLEVDPCIPPDWPSFEATVRHGRSTYAIIVANPNGVSRGVARATLDGIAVRGPALSIALVDDGVIHRLEVTLG